MSGIKVEFLNPFIKAAYQVLEQEAKANIGKGTPSVQESYFTLKDISVSIGVTGKVQGTVLYGMDERTAKGIVSAMVGGPVPIFDRVAESAVAELGNMITGIASGELEAAGYPCTISPPTVIAGRGTIISTVNIKRVLLPLNTQYGELEISLALQERLV